MKHSVKKSLVAIYLTVIFIMASAEPSEAAPIWKWSLYYLFVIANLAICVRLVNNLYKGSDHAA